MSKETIGIAADHGGFFLKWAIAEEIEAAGYQVLDLGTDSENLSITLIMQKTSSSHI